MGPLRPPGSIAASKSIVKIFKNSSEENHNNRQKLVNVIRQVAQTDIFVSFQRRFGHFYLLVGINMITHVVATFGDAVSEFFRNIRRNGASQPRFINRLVGLNYP